MHRFQLAERLAVVLKIEGLKLVLPDKVIAPVSRPKLADQKSRRSSAFPAKRYPISHQRRWESRKKKKKAPQKLSICHKHVLRVI